MTKKEILQDLGNLARKAGENGWPVLAAAIAHLGASAAMNEDAAALAALLPISNAAASRAREMMEVPS